MVRQFWVVLVWAAACPVRSAEPPAAQAEAPAVTAEALRSAVNKSLPLLLKGAVGHRENRTCFACHSQGLPILARPPRGPVGLRSMRQN